MRFATSFGALTAGLLLAGTAPAHAQVDVQIHLGLPVVLPPLVVVEPGVQVVPEVDDEVYFVDGWYWARQGPRWYRARDHRGGWVFVTPARVPMRLVRIPPGHYRHIDRDWRAEKHERKEWQKEERRERKDREKAEHAAWKAEEKDRKHRGKGHGHGHDED